MFQCVPNVLTSRIIFTIYNCTQRASDVTKIQGLTLKPKAKASTKGIKIGFVNSPKIAQRLVTNFENVLKFTKFNEY